MNDGGMVDEWWMNGGEKWKDGGGMMRNGGGVVLNGGVWWYGREE